MGNEVLVRTISAVVLGVAVLVVTWLGGLAFKLLSIVIMALVFHEWFRIVRTRTLSRAVWFVGALTMAAVAAVVLAGWLVLAWPLAVAGAALAALLRRLEGQDLWPSVGLVYAGFFGVAFVALRDGADRGFAMMIVLFAVIWCTDILAFFGGRTIGGPRLAPTISPKKTWSGFIAGLVGGTIGGIIAATLFGSGPILWIAFLSIVLSLAGQLGDLFESAFKRRFDVKDSGNIIPGHGGVLDRVDSLIFASFAAYLIGLAVSGADRVSGNGNGIAYQLLGP